MKRLSKDYQPEMALALERGRFTGANFHAVFEFDDHLQTLFHGPLLCIVFRFCKHLRSQNFCGIYFVDATVCKIGRHCTTLGIESKHGLAVWNGSAPFRSCLHDKERDFPCELSSSRLGDEAIPNRS
jgi:hypothetical protein